MGWTHSRNRSKIILKRMPKPAWSEETKKQIYLEREQEYYHYFLPLKGLGMMILLEGVTFYIKREEDKQALHFKGILFHETKALLTSSILNN